MKPTLSISERETPNAGVESVLDKAPIDVGEFQLFKKSSSEGAEPVHDKAPIDEGAVMAAIAMAIHELSEVDHDIEPAVLTIQQAGCTYSPWNAKIYGMRTSLK